MALEVLRVAVKLNARWGHLSCHSEAVWRQDLTHLTNPDLNSGTGVISFPMSSRALTMSIVATKLAATSHILDSAKSCPGHSLDPYCHASSSSRNIPWHPPATEAKYNLSGINLVCNLWIKSKISLWNESLWLRVHIRCLCHGPRYSSGKMSH